MGNQVMNEGVYTVNTPQEAAAKLVDKKNVMVLTGAGLSAASGIPTFRGKGGFWKQSEKSYGGATDPREIVTWGHFNKACEGYWEWKYDFMRKKQECKPNGGHEAIVKFQEYCAQRRSMDCSLVTQNTDDFHAELIKKSQILMKTEDKFLTKYGKSAPKAFTPHVFEIHGNTRWMHCSDEEADCSRKFVEAPMNVDDFDNTNNVPKCETCGKNMKGHGMFFDESYSEHYYRINSIMECVEKCDALIVVGTTLATGGAVKIVNQMNAKEGLIIEVNVEPCIFDGAAMQVIGKSEDTLPAMFNELYKLRNEEMTQTSAEMMKAAKATQALKKPEEAKATQAPKATVSPKGTVAAKTTAAPKSTVAAKTTTAPKATTAPKNTTVPKATAATKPAKK